MGIILQDLLNSERDCSRTTAPENSSKHLSTNPTTLESLRSLYTDKTARKNSELRSFPSLSQGRIQASCQESSHCKQWRLPFALAHICFLFLRQLARRLHWPIHPRFIPFSFLIGTFPSVYLFLLFSFLCLLFMTERGEGGKQKRHREGQKIPSQLHAVSREPD